MRIIIPFPGLYPCASVKALPIPHLLTHTRVGGEVTSTMTERVPMQSLLLPFYKALYECTVWVQQNFHWFLNWEDEVEGQSQDPLLAALTC